MVVCSLAMLQQRKLVILRGVKGNLIASSYVRLDF